MMRSSTVVAIVAIGLVDCQLSNPVSNVTTPFGGGPSGVSIAVGDSLGSTTPAFRPAVDTIANIDTVAWIVDAGAGDAPFNVTWDYGPTLTLPLNSGDLQAGQTYIAFFTQPGWYVYHCTHHANMTGSLLVLTAISGRILLRLEPHLASLPSQHERARSRPLASHSGPVLRSDGLGTHHEVGAHPQLLPDVGANAETQRHLGDVVLAGEVFRD